MPVIDRREVAVIVDPRPTASQRRGQELLWSQEEPTTWKELPAAAQKLQGRGDRGLFGERSKGWRLSVPPAIGHDTERLDEALPAARERDGHAEIDNLVC